MNLQSPHHHSHQTDPPIPIVSDAHLCPMFLLLMILLNLATNDRLQSHPCC